MPRLTRVGLALSFAYLLGSAFVGAWVLTGRGTGLLPSPPSMLSLHVEWMAVGFMLQFPLSVAYWILPKFGVRRGREALAGAGLVLLNVGLVLHGLTLHPSGRVLEGLGTVLFFLHAWRRVKPPTPFPH